MALPITIPSSPTGAASPTSTDGSNGPHTPASPSNPTTLSLPPPAEGSSASPPPAANNGPANGAPNKRKASRRANTAERRATHNAVERQRRETLNGRFLDLAALLPNLSQIRRPSKSSIVNSSIAHIHASRRHRMLAARELRLIKLEADALRRELNEWRDRSGLPRVEEPVRGEAFQMIMSGEVELLSAVAVEEEDGDEYGDDEFVGNGHSNGATRGNIADDIDQEMRGPMAHTAAVSLLKNSPDVGPFSHGTPTSDLRLQTMLSRSGAPGNGTPMIVSSPTGVSFENPAMVSMYEPHHGPLGAGQFAGQFFGNHGMGNAGEDKINWHYASLSGPGQQPFTPPPSQGNAQQAAYYMGMQRQQAMMQQQRSMGRAYSGAADGDDASSQGSAPSMRRERSGSMGSTQSGFGSPGAGSYDMPGAVPRRMGTGGAGFGEGMGMGLGGMGMGVGMMKNAPISVGGGNGHGYASMML